MQKSYKVVGSNGPHDALLNTTLTGELTLLPNLAANEFYSFKVGEIDYDLEIQDTVHKNGETFLFCWLTSEENCGRVCLQPIEIEEKDPPL